MMLDDVMEWAGHVLAECKTCGVWWWYQRWGGGPPRGHCPRCAILYVEPAKARPVPCKKCGVSFLALGVPPRTGRRVYQRKVCDACKPFHRKERACQRCGLLFTALRAADGTKYCSPECRRRRRLVPCRECGVLYRMKSVRGKPKVTCGKPKCVSACHVRYASPAAWKKAKRARGRIASHLRRVRVNVTGSERVGIEDVIERDGLKCHVCNRLMNLKNKAWKRRASLDHIIPLSQGGSHTMRNLRLAHLGCNVGRGKVSQAQEMLL